MEKVYISIVETEYGRWKITANDCAVLGIMPVKDEIFQNENEISSDAAKQIGEYFINIRKELDFPVELRGTPFQLEVWNLLRQIPYGHTMTYGQVANRLGRPNAVRAVGQAVGRNPCLILIPCHRVLGRNGKLTGFSAGIEWKKQLLSLENIPFCE